MAWINETFPIDAVSNMELHISCEMCNRCGVKQSFWQTFQPLNMPIAHKHTHTCQYSQDFRKFVNISQVCSPRVTILDVMFIGCQSRISLTKIPYNIKAQSGYVCIYNEI